MEVMYDKNFYHDNFDIFYTCMFHPTLFVFSAIFIKI